MKSIFMVVMLGFTFLVLSPPISQPTIEEPEWCLHSEFESLKHYHQTAPPANTVFIKLEGKKALVYVKCDLRYTQ